MGYRRACTCDSVTETPRIAVGRDSSGSGAVERNDLSYLRRGQIIREARRECSRWTRDGDGLLGGRSLLRRTAILHIQNNSVGSR